MNNSSIIDVRSDTVTQPTDSMRDAMRNAVVGDDVYKSDPTVNRLQDMSAELLGHEAALFMPTGTQSNLVALLTHCQRGDEYIVGSDAHTYKYEGGGAAALGGIQPQPLAFGNNGELPLHEVEQLIKADDVHFAVTKLLCLENTQHGRVQSLEYMQTAREFAQRHNLLLHLDGARMANAAVALGTTLEAVAKPFHTVSLCLSKGLGAPVGSVLVGDKAFIEQALRWRKVAGGGMRQAGVLAAAGILALTDGFDRLHQDHERAARLAELLNNLPGATVRKDWTQTNMVWLDYDAGHASALSAHAESRGLLLSTGKVSGRVVMHRNISDKDVETVAKIIKGYFEQAVSSSKS